MKQNVIYLMLLAISLFTSSCIKEIDLSRGNLIEDKPVYLYPFQNEGENVKTEILIKTRTPLSDRNLHATIPYLKYNKSWLFMLTQDDCKQVAFSCTWAAINGKPLTNKYFYNAGHLLWGDLPPDIWYLGKTLGSTNGAGNEVRFAPTTTLAPDQTWMNEKSEILLHYQKNFSRFGVKKGLVWNNVREMLNYGWGIAFHNLVVNNEKDVNVLIKQYPNAQDSILKHLNGRGCKTLAEPDGNKAYVTAALEYPPIQTMVAQAGTVKLYPFKVTDDLHNVLIERWFNDSPNYFKPLIEEQLQKPKEERMAIYIGVHGTDSGWVNFLLWLNDNYGKDGDDSMWFPSQEEYYEYNYYRTHGAAPQIEVIDETTLKLTVDLPSGQYFYYPSVTVNLTGLKKQDIVSIETDNAVSGLSYADFEDKLMLNIDCRKYLTEHATHFVEQYENDKSNASNKADALYFVNMLKDSQKKTELLNRIK
ncbi:MULTISPECIES: polysaccharide deacetylase family protein [Bacteroides]|jgi:hypothetical protein|uniref:Uncharacterized protein n=1 Tax=Bacteroides nordii CL02T12C05 TaxID=997884 RepID=I9S3I8_9BACE|nr:hypothetical protein [Bacteroides nordii]EIY49778.1 hypothetical protein HMPREF1068_02337 [Bacteroides nordii CL02T12C05]MCE8464573.1 hypothetical protein [Bacteroides nordii]MCG4768373.1 hypothetical protein [Bacteroides nordii]UYU49935.1 hypothetical protein KQP55_04830 [Bacteroides nordii]